MYKSKLSKHFVLRVLSCYLILLITILLLTEPVLANSPVYEGAYNIHDAIAYADEYTDYEGDYNPAYGFYKRNGDCTNFVSQCISIGGGIPQTGRFIPNSSDKNLSNPWTVPKDLYRYLTKLKGYSAGSFSAGYRVDHKTNTVSSWTKGSTTINVGDVVFFDFKCDGTIDHSAIIVGFNSDGMPCYAGHTNNRWMQPLLNAAIDQGYDIDTKCKYYIVHMTDIKGLVDVTSRYIGKTVSIRSIEVNQYVSSCTDQDTDTVDAAANRNSASAWEFFDVVTNVYGEVGFKARSNGNYLSSRVDLDSTSAPIRAAYGKDYTAPKSWESFRIFEKNGIQYIQSQANGKWVQVVANQSSHILKASAKEASTWERFDIRTVEPQSNNNTVGTDSTQMPSDTAAINTVSNQRYGSGYNEGVYSGEWSNHAPNGFGKLEYIDYNGDGKFYQFFYENKAYKALYYEGYFSNGARYGAGTVVYEGGWKEEGTYYGAWEPGKKVFEGKVFYANGAYYLEGYLTATSAINGEWTWTTKSWQPVK